MSAGDDIDQSTELSYPYVSLYALDLYRFALGNAPGSLSAFETATRSNVPGQAEVLSDTVNLWSLSTGFNNGDGRQSALERAGAGLAAKYLTSGEGTIALDAGGLDAEAVASVLTGLRLRAWRYDAYRTKLKLSFKYEGQD